MFEDMNWAGWTFIISLAMAFAGFAGFMAARTYFGARRIVASDENEPAYSSVAPDVMNRDFNTATTGDTTSHWSGKASLALFMIGIVIQVGLWTWVYNFAPEGFSFLNE